MNRITLFIVAALLACGVAQAQNAGSAQGSASVSTPNASGSAAASGTAGPGNAQGGASANLPGTQAGVNAQGQRANGQTSGSGSTSATAGRLSATSSNSAQSGSRQAAAASGTTVANGTTMAAKLDSALDAKKNKPGDEVVAQLTKPVEQDGQMVLPKGTRLVGHVTEAVARDKSQTQSALGVTFDQAVMRSGQTIPMTMGIAALAISQTAAQGSAADSGFVGATGGAGPIAAGGAGHAGVASGLVGGTGSLAGGAVATTTSAVGSATSSVGSSVNAIGSTSGSATGSATSTVNGTTRSASGSATGGLDANGALTPASRGVFGLRGLTLDSSATGATQGSMIVSATRNVHLDSGTQMVLQIAGQAGAN